MQSLPINDYQYLLDTKIAQKKKLFAGIKMPNPKIYPSAPTHYRMRSEFRIWHEGPNLFHIIHDPETKKRVKIKSFPIASELINQAMLEIVPLLAPNVILRHRLFQINYLSTLNNQLIISLIYHRKLGDNWYDEAKLLKQALIKKGINVHIVGRSHKQKIVLDQDYVDEEFTIHGKQYIYRQIENCFTQPNAQININMLSWAIEMTRHFSGDLLELYCGNGNFSIALAQNFKNVLATEIANASARAAQYNIEINRLQNIKIARLSAEELTQALRGTRKFNRLNAIDLADYHFSTVLVDPPRSGLDRNTLAMIQEYDNIIYISCNPLSLQENLLNLTQTHEIKHVAFFDQFPYTHHLEIGVVLNRYQ